MRFHAATLRSRSGWTPSPHKPYRSVLDERPTSGFLDPLRQLYQYEQYLGRSEKISSRSIVRFGFTLHSDQYA
jgi:hypothetical protein